MASRSGEPVDPPPTTRQAPGVKIRIVGEGPRPFPCSPMDGAVRECDGAHSAVARTASTCTRTLILALGWAVMAAMTQETAYYLDTRLPRLALIAKGIRFPAGQWIRVAGGTVTAWHVEELVSDLFPGLRGRLVPFRVLLTDFDVTEYEREVRTAQEPG